MQNAAIKMSQEQTPSRNVALQDLTPSPGRDTRHRKIRFAGAETWAHSIQQIKMSQEQT
jgi:hypothetical protein